MCLRDGWGPLNDSKKKLVFSIFLNVMGFPEGENSGQFGFGYCFSGFVLKKKKTKGLFFKKIYWGFFFLLWRLMGRDKAPLPQKKKI